jgi:hypothetical protein
MKLPDLTKLEDYNGSWDAYIEAIYQIFKTDFIDKKTYYNKTRVALKKIPLLKGKEACFWHLTSEGKIEEQRTPDLRKCEKIGWIKPIIENSQDDTIKFWISKRKKGNSSIYEDRICLCYGNWEYLVVLVDRGDYILLWTAHPIDYQHTKDKLKKEYESYKANTAP